jgi:predicted transcriptional regulator
MTLFDKDQFELLRLKVIEGQASPEEYELYREMLKSKEEAQQKVEFLSKKLEEINNKIGELKKERKEVEQEIERIISIYKLPLRYKSKRRSLTYDITSIPDDANRFSFGYLSWYREYDKIYTTGKSRKTGEYYRHGSPIIHFQTILGVILKDLAKSGFVSISTISHSLQGMDLGDGTFYRKGLEYRIRVALGVLEQEKLIYPVRLRKGHQFSTSVSEEEVWNWFKEKILEPWLKEMLERGPYKAILSFQGKIPENQTIKGIFLAARTKLEGIRG